MNSEVLHRLQHESHESCPSLLGEMRERLYSEGARHGRTAREIDDAIDAVREQGVSFAPLSLLELLEGEA